MAAGLGPSFRHERVLRGKRAQPRKMEIAVRNKKKTFTIAQKANLKKDIQKYFFREIFRKLN